jgi:hypothetical protein
MLRPLPQGTVYRAVGCHPSTFPMGYGTGYVINILQGLRDPTDLGDKKQRVAFAIKPIEKDGDIHDTSTPEYFCRRFGLAGPAGDSFGAA